MARVLTAARFVALLAATATATATATPARAARAAPVTCFGKRAGV